MCYMSFQKQAFPWRAYACLAVSSIAIGCGSDKAPISASSSDGDAEADVKSESVAQEASLAEPAEFRDLDAGDENRLLPEGGTAVTGTVVDFATNRPLANRTIAVGDHVTATDSAGMFVLAGVPATYSITIADPDRSGISIYRGLTRRDPMLSHRRADNHDPPSSRAQVNGSLFGGGPYPLTSAGAVAVYFFSREADAHRFLGGGLPAALGGPAYGPMTLLWDGPEQIAGQLVALGIFQSDGGHSAWLANQGVTLTSGESAVLDLNLAPVAEGRLSGNVLLPTGSSLVQLQQYYRLPFPNAVIALGNQENPSSQFAYVVSDLGAIGAKLCVAASGSPDLWASKCGLSLGQDVSITLQPAPTLTMPSSDQMVMKDTQFSWSDATAGMHVLSLEAETPSRSTPNIYVYTAGTTVLWPNVEGLGVPFPGGASYVATVAAFGPYATIDDAVGPQGLGALVPTEAWESHSPSILFSTDAHGQ